MHRLDRIVSSRLRLEGWSEPAHEEMAHDWREGSLLLKDRFLKDCFPQWLVDVDVDWDVN